MLAIGLGFFGPTEGTEMWPEAHPGTARTVSGRARHEAHHGPCFFFLLGPWAGTSTARKLLGRPGHEHGPSTARRPDSGRLFAGKILNGGSGKERGQAASASGGGSIWRSGLAGEAGSVRRSKVDGARSSNLNVRGAGRSGGCGGILSPPHFTV